ncbi:MAG TPA: diaminopimelate decarboxylase [Candidatus Polarisedimenticolaceae bacterium]|nr:diaminopimelate decarboxylase [Candidatus Polarisedimenticolaceae bacterium]
MAVDRDGAGVEAADSPWWSRRRGELLELANGATPLYVYDEETLRGSVGELRLLRAVERVFYSVKANAHPDVLGVLRGSGLGFECVSPGEVDHVLGQFPDLEPQRVLFTPNFAPRGDYSRAFEAGVQVTLDNVYPLGAWPEVFAGRDLLVRVDPGQGQGHHPYVRTAGHQSKFGVSPDQLKLIEGLAATVRARIIGLHAHVGSGITDADTWVETAKFLAGLAAALPDVRVLDLGGGLGVPEQPDEPALDLPALATKLETFRSATPQYALWMEPGRYLVAEAGVLLTRVTQLKAKSGVRYVGVDAGMNSLLRPSLYGARHAIVNLTRLGEPATIVAEIVGPICETADVLGSRRPLPATEEGDVLLVATAGAYGAVMGSRYNLREPAAERLLPARGYA